MRKEKKSFNWAKYENGWDNEIRKLAELLKSVFGDWVILIGQRGGEEEGPTIRPRGWLYWRSRCS